MRDVKFKIYDISKDEMSDASQTINTLTANGNVLLQSLEILDSNGVEIYEGDILQINANTIGVVVWLTNVPESYGFRWPGFMIEVKDANESVFYYTLERNRFQVVGNIYQNPELIPV